MSSCKKIISIPEPVSSITATEVFSTDMQANSVLAGIYADMISNTGNLVFSNGATTIFSGLSADELIAFAGNDPFNINSLQANNSYINTYFWQPAYWNIYGANAAIAGLSVSTSGLLHDSVKNELIGEAKFIRAFCYFYLTNLFGDVPLVLTTDFNQTALMARTSQTSIYKQIIEDLKDAQKVLQTDYSVWLGERVRPNKWAATALLARVYLYINDWENAEVQASAVINNSSLFGLASNLNDVFNKNSSEAIWQLHQNSTVKLFNGTWDGEYFFGQLSFYDLSSNLQTLILNNFAEYGSYVLPACYISSQLANSFEPGDQRKVQWLDSIPNPNGASYYYPYKYTVRPRNTTVGGSIPQYYMVLRLAEQYLIRAEARAQQGNLSNAADDLDTIRNRAGLLNTNATSKENLLTAIFHERQVELFAEWGHRWLDLKRTGQANIVLSSIPWKQPWSTNSLLYPIPLTELQADPNLKQNPGY